MSLRSCGKMQASPHGVRHVQEVSFVCIASSAPPREALGWLPILPRPLGAASAVAPTRAPLLEGSSQTVKLQDKANLLLCFQSLTPFLRSSNRQGAKKTHVCLGFFAPLRETFSRPPIFSRSPSADMPNAPIGPPPRDGSSQTLKLPNRANLFLCFQSLTLFVRLSTSVQDAPCSHLSHRRS